MKRERVRVKDISSLFEIIKQRGGGEGRSLSDVPAEIKSEHNFICRWECEDGSIIDFIASDTKSAAQFPSEIRGDSEKLIEKFCKELVELAGDPNPFVSVVKGHAYIESMLMSIIGSAILEYKELELDRMTFTKKVRLCTALGLIHTEVSHVLLEFANIRNRFAHQVWPEFTKKELRNFLNVLRQSKLLKDHLPKQRSRKLDIFDCVWAMWIYLFQQILRVSLKRNLLINFWKSVVDTERDTMPQFELPLKPIVIGKRK